MRIISQDGTIDVPYDYFSLTIATGKYEDVEVACIYCHNLSSPKGTKLAEYSSKEKAEKAMEMLRTAYAGTPLIFENCDVADEVFEELKRRSIEAILTVTNDKPKIDYLDNFYFRFPKDEDVEE